MLFYPPFFYSVYVDDLLNILEKSGLGLRIGGIYSSAPMYADDSVLVASSPKELQGIFNIVSNTVEIPSELL